MEHSNPNITPHPTPDELAEFLYSELSPAKHLEVTSHVESCAGCRQKLAEWRETRAALHAWKLAEHSSETGERRGEQWGDRRIGLAAPVLRWGMAAAILLAIGYGVGRINAKTNVDVVGMKAQITEQVRGELQADLNRLAAVQAAQQQQEYERALVQATSQLDQRRVADYASLRQDVETVAYRTQEKFDSLASAQLPSGSAHFPSDNSATPNPSQSTNP